MQFRGFLFIWCILIAGIVQAQEVTFYDHIAPIIHANCTPCHSPGNPGPFSLITYDDVAKRGPFVAHVTETKYMPPWHADPEFRHYKNERGLSAQEIKAIQDWVKGGMKEGKKRKIKLQSTEMNILPNSQPDIELTMTQDFQIPGTSSEEFRFFYLPLNLPEDRYVAAVEFIPGNKRLVHHSRVMVDTSGKISAIDGFSEADPQVRQFQTVPLYDEFLYGWVPGNFPLFYPEGTGRRLPKGANLILNVHYAPSATPATDRSTVRLYLAKGPVSNEVRTLALNENFISNQPFVLKAGTKPTFYMSSGVIDEDISLISVLPHMHLLGKSFKAFAITPEGDLINLVKIDRWDFNWQTTYQFQELVHLPKGSVILAEATFDNSSDNPANPNVPPRDVTYGWNTTDEMMNLIFYYISLK